jgi:hypothetical protein
VERVVHKARDFKAAAEWDVQQQVCLTPRERRQIARKLKERVYGREPKDVRSCPRTA